MFHNVVRLECNVEWGVAISYTGESAVCVSPRRHDAHGTFVLYLERAESVLRVFGCSGGCAKSGRIAQVSLRRIIGSSTSPHQPQDPMHQIQLSPGLPLRHCWSAFQPVSVVRKMSRATDLLASRMMLGCILVRFVSTCLSCEDKRRWVVRSHSSRRAAEAHLRFSSSRLRCSSISASSRRCARIRSCTGGSLERTCGSSVKGYTNCDATVSWAYVRSATSMLT